MQVCNIINTFLNMDKNSFWLMKVNFILLRHLHINSHLGSPFHTIFFFNGEDRDPFRTPLQREFKSQQFHLLFFHHMWDFAHLLYNLNLKWKESIRWRASSHNCFHYWSACRKVQILKTFQSFCPTTKSKNILRERKCWSDRFAAVTTNQTFISSSWNKL